jgi:hypothetical protein
MTEVYG